MHNFLQFIYITSSLDFTSTSFVLYQARITDGEGSVTKSLKTIDIKNVEPKNKKR